MIDLLTPTEAAKRLGITARALKLHRERLTGLPYVRIGGCIRYMARDILAAREEGFIEKMANQRRQKVKRPVKRRRPRRIRRR